MDQLKRRGFSLANRCPLCRKDKENIEHTLLHCPMVWGIWSFLLMSVGGAWVPPWLIKDWFFGWNNFPVRKSERLGGLLLFLSVLGNLKGKEYSRV